MHILSLYNMFRIELFLISKWNLNALKLPLSYTDYMNSFSHIGMLQYSNSES